MIQYLYKYSTQSLQETVNSCFTAIVDCGAYRFDPAKRVAQLAEFAVARHALAHAETGGVVDTTRVLPSQGTASIERRIQMTGCSAIY